jgi:hypothetical protein
VPLLSRQLFATRRTIAHAVVASVLKNETVIESPQDVDGVLELCHVLIKDQGDAGVPGGSMPQVAMQDGRRVGPSFYLEREDMAEEQGWVARLVHLFRADSLDVQFEVWVRIVLRVHPPETVNAASSNCKTSLRNWRRANAVHLPRADHFDDQALPKV